MLVEDEDRALRHADLVKSVKFPNASDPVGFPWPFTVDDAGWLLQTFSAPCSPCTQPHPFFNSTAASTRANAAAPAQTLSLGQNYPNPCNSGTVIRFALPASQQVELAIYNLAGQKLATLIQGVHQAGVYGVHWDGRDSSGRDLASGTYLYRLRTSAQVETRKLSLVR